MLQGVQDVDLLWNAEQDEEETYIYVFLSFPMLYPVLYLRLAVTMAAKKIVPKAISSLSWLVD